MAEADLTVVLLFTDHLAVLCYLQEHDLLLVMGQQHEHTGCEKTGGEGVLTVEGQRPQVGHVRIEKNKRNGRLMQMVGHLLRDVKRSGDDDHAVGLVVEARFCLSDKAVVVETVIIVDTHGDIEVFAHISGFLDALLHFLPVGYLVMTGDKYTEVVRFVIGQG